MSSLKKFSLDTHECLPDGNMEVYTEAEGTVLTTFSTSFNLDIFMMLLLLITDKGCRTGPVTSAWVWALV